MKVLHVVRNLDRYSGAAYQALNLARYQQLNGIDVTVLNVSDNGAARNELIANVSVITVRRTLGIWFFFKMFSRYNVSHFHGMFMLEMLVAKLSGCKILLKTTLLGEDDLDSIRERSFGLLRTLFLKWMVDLNNSLSMPIEQINSKYFNKKSLCLIPNFVEKNIHVGHAVKENTVVYVGSIVERKRVLDAIDFFEKEIQPAGYDMAIIGPCDIFESQNDVDYVKRFFDKIQNNRCLKYLGKISQGEVLKVLARSKALVFLSDKEGMPNVVLEALAANCFVITSSISGIASDIYMHRQEGFNVDSNDEFDIDLLEQSVQGGFPISLAEKKFYFSNNVHMYTKVYKEM